MLLKSDGKSAFTVHGHQVKSGQCGNFYKATVASGQLLKKNYLLPLLTILAELSNLPLKDDHALCSPPFPTLRTWSNFSIHFSCLTVLKFVRIWFSDPVTLQTWFFKQRGVLLCCVPVWQVLTIGALPYSELNSIGWGIGIGEPRIPDVGAVLCDCSPGRRHQEYAADAESNGWYATHLCYQQYSRAGEIITFWCCQPVVVANVQQWPRLLFFRAE